MNSPFHFRMMLVCTLLSFLFLVTPLNAADDTPVLLIHGLASSSNSWDSFAEQLKKEGYQVFTLNFNDWNDLRAELGAKKQFADLCVVVDRQIARITAETGAEKVNIIAHSIGGLVARGYIADWGKQVDKSAGYKNNVKKLVFIMTPHFGLDISKSTLSKLLTETDYGRFLNAGELVTMLKPGSKELFELNKYFIDSGASVGVGEMTLSSLSDSVVTDFSANLDGVEAISNYYVIGNFTYLPSHLYLRDRSHADINLLKEDGTPILDNNSDDNLIIRIVDSFFKNGSWWRQKSQGRADTDSHLQFNFKKAKGFKPKKLKNKSVKLYYYENKRDLTKIKVYRNKDSKVFYVNGIKSGSYKIIIPFGKKKKSFNFSLSIPLNSSLIYDFDPSNPPPDPFEVNDDDDDGSDGGDGSNHPYDSYIPDGIIIPAEEPEVVNSLETLRKFALYHLRGELWVPQQVNMWDISKRLRDLVVNKFDEYFLPWVDAEIAHFDVFGNWTNVTSIDFVLASSSPGILWDKLIWLVNSNPRWAR